MTPINKKSLEKLPPHNLETEQAVLGAIFLDNAAIYNALEHLQPADFYRESHRKIFEAMLALIQQESPVDLLLLRDELTRRRQLDEVGGPAYLAGLVDQVPTAANIEYHAKVVHDKARARRLLNASIETVSLCYDEMMPIEELFEQYLGKINDILDRQASRGMTPASELIPKLYSLLADRADHPEMLEGMSTGFDTLDRLTAGWKPGELTILAARPSVGKSAFACQIAEKLLKQQKAVAFFTLEMSEKDVASRLVCCHAHVSGNVVKSPWNAKDEDWEALSDATELLSKTSFFVDDSRMVTPLQIFAKASRLRSMNQLDMIIIDYLQLVTPDKAGGNRAQDVGQISRQLKIMAGKLNVPVLALSQFNREADKERPRLSHLRESGSLEQDSDNVFFLHRSDEKRDPYIEEIELMIEKQRNGAVGSLSFTFFKDMSRFEPLSHRSESETSGIFC